MDYLTWFAYGTLFGWVLYPTVETLKKIHANAKKATEEQNGKNGD